MNKEILPSSKIERLRNKRVEIDYNKVKVPDSLVNFPFEKTFFIHTFGCQANYRDEEIMAGLLYHAGFIRTSDYKNASIIILNTCAVRENAEQKVYGHLGELKAVKRLNKNAIICLCGCMMQEEKSAPFIKKTYPYVSLIFGTHNVVNILDLLDEHITSKKMVINVPSSSDSIKENLPDYRNSKFSAFVNITYGCDKFCSYCVVPLTRGQERSRKEEDILRECKYLFENDYKEVTLLGQNVNSYGLDLKDGSNFADLLEKVAKLGFPRVRFLTSYPSQFDDHLIDVIARNKNITRYIHLPVQAGSNRVLKAMNRRYTREFYLDLVKRMHEKIPNLHLSTDIIVGFPNETYEEFLETLSLVKEVKFASAFTFIFSSRANTPASKMQDNVPYEEKSRRFKMLVETIEEGIIEYNAKMIGKTYKVLVEGISERNKEMLSGYTEDNKLVHFKGDVSLIGQIVDVKILTSHVYSLIGELK